MTDETGCYEHDDWDDECGLCIALRHKENNAEAYRRMGEL